MAQLSVKIELAAPLLAGTWKPNTNVLETLGYLPGAALRGALVDALTSDWTPERKKAPHPEQCPDRKTCSLCRVLFPLEAAEPRFGDCYPALADDEPQALPATARTCKRYPGFLRPEDPEGGHGIFDALIRQAAFESAVNDSDRPLPYLYEPHCQVCGEGVDAPPVAHYARFDENTFYSASAVEQRLSRTAINRARWAAQDEQLYTLSLLSEKMSTGLISKHGGRIEYVQSVTILKGTVRVADGREETMKVALQSMRWVGAGRSRGLGECNVTAKVVPEVNNRLEGLGDFAAQAEANKFERPETTNTLIGRLQEFNRLLQSERAFWMQLGVPVLPGQWYFSVDLLADAILRDNGAPTLQLTPEMIGITGDGKPLVKHTLSAVNRTYRSGWSGAKGLPRPVKLAAARGGVYLFAVEAGDATTMRKLVERLAELEAEGIGEERERGCGRLIICAPFHLEVEPR
ncbi:MAG TPA: type III-B CRISPR module-associated Cmr3 family protein [Anaerolineales bacterium]|nr:type III-B CRISPR module-associated Cmr3 family protein [Anaerolineales bacterium]